MLTLYDIIIFPSIDKQELGFGLTNFHFTAYRNIREMAVVFVGPS